MKFRKSQFSKIYLAILFIMLVVLMGVVGFMIVEGYSLLDAIYMTVITVSTVGFQEVQPLSKVGRLFTSFLIITTFGTFAYAVSVLTSVFVSGEYKHYYKQYTMKKQVNKINNHIIVCGFGRNGSQAVKKLDTHNQKYIVVDKNNSCFDDVQNNSIPFINGDATLDNTLEKAGISKAKALISCLSSDADNLYVVLSARQKNKNITKISRSSSNESSNKLKIAGADKVIMPDKLGGAHMAALVTNPDVVEFLDSISLEGDAEINLDEISFENLPANLRNKTIKDLNIKYQTSCNIVGYKTSDGKYVINPHADTLLLPHSKLFVLGNSQQISQLNNIFNVQ